MEYKLLYKAISDETMVLRFFGPKMSFKPGQFVQIKKGDLIRAYSIASSPSMPYLEFIIHIVGKFTNLLKNAKIGESFEIKGPYGKLSFNNEKKAVFIAGGTGIAPIMSIIRYIIENKINGEYYAFISNKNVQKHPFLSEMEIYDKTGLIRSINTFTSIDVPNYKHGRFNINEFFKGKDFTYFLCGSLSMVRSIKQALEEKGAKDIKLEGWG